MNNWITKSNFYHIYPLGFCGAETYHSESSETPVNRIKKITEWIPHLKEMHINAVYLGPLFESTKHGYDTIDYKVCDRRLGTNADLKHVCDELHANGIRIVFDGVFNHVGRDFHAFKDVQQNRESSRYCGWFQNLNFGGNTPCNDGFWYEGWAGHYDLVKLNLRNPEVADYLISVIEFWIDEFGIDGIRFDAADCLDMDFIKRVHGFTRSKKQDFWLMGEIIHGDYARWANNDMFDSVTNYECYKGLYSSHNDRNYFEIAHSIKRQNGNGGIYKDIYLYNFLDNHDVNRIASTLKDIGMIGCVYTMMYTMYGVPSIYYGSEYGVKGTRTNTSDDALRPCLDLNNIPDKNEELFRLICKLGKIREENIIIQEGSFDTVELKNQTILYKRVRDNCTVYVALNISDGDYTFNFDSQYRTLEDKLTGEIFKADGNRMSITSHKNQPRILVQADDALPAGTVIDETDKPAEIVSVPVTESEPKPAEAPVSEAKPEPVNEAVPLPMPEPPIAKPVCCGTPSAGDSGRQIVLGGHYKHFKGGDYVVLNVAKNSETLEDMVVYMQIYDKPTVWVRPLKMFMENVNDHGNIKPRFELVTD